MKKLLVLISLILCVSMLFVACGQNNNGEENNQPEDNIEANIAKLVSELNKGENFEDIFNTTKTTVDYEKLVAELKKVSAKGAVDLTATEDGEDVGTVTGSFAIKDNVIHAEANNGEETVGIDASISDAYKLMFATWIDEEAELDIGEVVAFDIKAVWDEMMEMADEGMAEKMPIDLSEIKLPEFKAEHITYKDGKYVLDKNFLYDSVVATADSFIDAAKEEGLITEDMDIDAQLDEIKEKAKKAVDAVDFSIYYLVKYEVVEGMGFYVDLKADTLADALELPVEDAGFDYFKASIEATLTGTKANAEFKLAEDSYVNKVSYDLQFIFDGEAICGVDAKYDMDIKSTSKSQSASKDDEYGYWSKYESTDIMKQSVSVKLDLSKFDEANATVLDTTFKMSSDYKSVNEYGSNYDATTKNESHNTQEVEFTVTVKTTEANKADVVMNGKNHSTRTSTDEDREDRYETSTIGLTGTVEFTTKDVTVPAPDADVKDAMDNAEVVTSVMGKGEAPAPDYGYGDDYYEGGMVTPMPEMPEETMGW